MHACDFKGVIDAFNVRETAFRLRPQTVLRALDKHL